MRLGGFVSRHVEGIFLKLTFRAESLFARKVSSDSYFSGKATCAPKRDDYFHRQMLIIKVRVSQVRRSA